MIKLDDGTRYLALFGSEKYDYIYNKIRYLINVKSVITYVIYHNYANIKANLYDSLLLEKAMTFHNVIILMSHFEVKIKIITTVIYF